LRNKLPQSGRLERSALRDVVSIGRILTEVRDVMPHGQWLPWLEREFAWAPRTAQRYIGAYALVSKNDTLSHLEPSALFYLAAPTTPDPVRAEVIDRAAKGERLTHRDVKAIARRKPQRVCMSNLRLPFVHSYRDRHGKMRHAFRRRGYKTVSLPGAVGSRAFMNAYQAALAEETAPRLEIGESRTKAGSVAQAIALYLGSSDYTGLVLRSKRALRLLLDHFREDYGDKPIADLHGRHIEQMLASKSPYAARDLFHVPPSR
jgi:hypothetical protein